MKWLEKLLGRSPTPPPSNGADSAVPRSHSVESSRLQTPADLIANFPFPVVELHGTYAEQEWRNYQAAWRKEGASAVLVGSANDVSPLVDMMEFAKETPEDILRAADALSAETYFADRRREFGRDDGMPTADDWPDKTVPEIQLGAHLDVLSRRPKEKVYLARIPTARAWELPAFLKFGGWNDCPDPATQVAVLKYWSHKYQIEVYAMTGDVLECTVAHPPATKDAAIALAEEQFLFCTDIVYQGTESMGLLAATLQDSSAWYFWWD